MNDYNKTKKMIGMGLDRKHHKNKKTNLPHIFTNGTLINGVEIDEPNKNSFQPHEPYEYQDYLDEIEKYKMPKKRTKKHRGGSFLPIGY